MPYEIEAVRYKRKWVTLPVALARVVALDKCDDFQGQCQILDALEDGNIWNIWGDIEPLPPFNGWDAEFGGDYPPWGGGLDNWLWSYAEINWVTGMVLDHRLDNKERPVLLWKESVENLWPKPEAAPNSKAEKTSKKTKAKAETIREAAKKLIDSNNGPGQIGWGEFRKKVREELGFPSSRPIPRGYGDDTIENLVRPLLEVK